MKDDIREAIKSEIKKCAIDPVYFLTKYVKIKHPVRGKVRFDLYDYQKEALHQFEDNDYNIVLKGRQLGFSTLVAGYSLWLMLFHNDKEILVIATKQETAKNLVSKVQYMHDSLPVWLKGNIKSDNKLSLSFSNNSNIKAIARSKDAGRSESLSLLILDEAAFIDKADEIWGAASSTLSTGGKAILISTPNGVGNFFHKTWQDAEAGINGFNTMLLDWRVHPDRDQAWRDRQTEILGEVAAIQEHDASFLFSGNTVIKPEITEFYKNTFMQEPISKQGFDNNLWIWEYPLDNKTYILAGDVARGDATDYSAFHILEAESMTQVAEYKGKISPKDFGNLMVATATQYNDALIIPDNSTIGWTAIQQVIDRGYNNLFYMSKDLQVVDTSRQYNTSYYKEEKTMVPGFTISARTRPLIIAKLDEYMRDNAVTIRSSRTLAELDTFIWKNGKAEALDQYNDDLVMSLCIGLWVRDTALKLKNERMEMTKLSLDKLTTKTMPFRVGSNDPSDPRNHYNFNNGREVEDISWLVR